MTRCFFFSSRRRHTRFDCDWSSDVCSSDLIGKPDSSASKVALTHGLLLVADAERILREPDVDVIVTGDAVEWEAAPYFQDMVAAGKAKGLDRKSTRLNSSHSQISYAVFCLKKKKKTTVESLSRPRRNGDKRRATTASVTE